MSDRRAIANRYADEFWNTRNWAVLDEIFASAHTYHDAVLGELPRGPEGARQRANIYVTAIPDARLTGEQWAVDGDVVVLRWTFSGTHTGELLGMPPTGRPVTTTGMCMFRFEGDKIAETWNSYDALGFLRQLGLVQIGQAEPVA
jgi:steroid delta-isomerase-like uncharacterized protein